MKKILLILLMICLLNGNIFYTNAEDSNKYVKVVFSSTYIYLDSDINVDYDQDGECLDVLKEEKYGVLLKLVKDEQIVGLDGLNYYCIEINGNQGAQQGYVLCSNVLYSTIQSPQKELDYNATLNKETHIYTLENQNFIETNEVLKSGQKIKILDGYNKENKYSRIQYLDEIGQILTAYVRTEDIKTSGISRSVIGAVIIIITTVSLVLLVFGIKGKKKKSISGK